jgi:hypothetical protein
MTFSTGLWGAEVFRSFPTGTQQTCDGPSRRHASLLVGDIASLLMMLHN